MKIGEKIKFKEEKQRYTVQACNERFAICTKPFNCRKTVLYTIIDFQRNVRGRDNLVFGFYEGYETRGSCETALKELMNNEMEVSYRHFIPLNIEL